MSIRQYFGQKVDSDGTPLIWPGGPEGYPFRGTNPPLLNKDEYDDLQLSYKARARVFYIAKEEDLKAYIDIRERMANGLYMPIDRDRAWDELSGGYRIYLEWLEPSYIAVPTTKPEMKDVIADSSASVTLPYSKLAGLSASKGGW